MHSSAFTVFSIEQYFQMREESDHVISFSYFHESFLHTMSYTYPSVYLSILDSVHSYEHRAIIVQHSVH